MKKFAFIVICLMLMASALAGCTGPAGGGQKNIEGSLEDLMQKIYDNLDPTVELPFTANEALTQEGTQFNTNVAYFIGADDIPFTEGLVSEPAFGAIPLSIVLLRMEKDADIEGAMSRMRAGIDPMKWICVGVDPSDVIVDNIGDLVVLIMSKDSKAIHEAFKKLAD